MASINNTFLARDFLQVDGIEDKLTIRAGLSIPTHLAIKALEGIEKRDRIKSFFSKRSVVILSAVFILCTQIALFLIIGPATFATLPTLLKVSLIVTRITAYAMIIFGIIQGNGLSDAYKENADKAHALLEELRNVKEDSIKLKLISNEVVQLTQIPDESDQETSNDDSENELRAKVQTQLLDANIYDPCYDGYDEWNSRHGS